MKIAIFVVTQDADIRAFFDNMKGSVVPKELRKGGFQYNALTIDPTCSEDELFSFLVDAHEKHDAVGVLVDSGWEERFNDCLPAMFTKVFHAEDAKSSMKNYFAHNLSRWLKNLLHVSRAFTDGKQQKCLLLPFSNFAAAEGAEILRLCADENDKGRFQELLERELKIMRSRSVPKKKKSGRQHFIKDEGNRYFELGKEKHGKSETSVPPHAHQCKLTAWARFGVTLNRNSHYNITLESGDISGQFIDCHGSSIYIKPCSHINMFPNGFIR